MFYRDYLTVSTQGRGTYDITQAVQSIVKNAGIETGICHLFIQHTSASVILCENADPAVRTDLETFMVRIAPDGDPSFLHQDEGPDDMAAHIRTILTATDLQIPISQCQCALGVWQGVYLWEHRAQGHQRKCIVSVFG